MACDYELQDSIIHLRFESKSSSKSKENRDFKFKHHMRLCNVKNPCKEIALVYLG